VAKAAGGCRLNKKIARQKETRRPREREEDRRKPAPAVEKEVIAEIRTLAETLCDTEGLELVHVEYRREQTGRVMRFYLDKPGGVTLEDCSTVSRELGDALDVHLPHLGPYRLEVSSPGASRPLSQAKDFERFTGREAKIRTTAPIDGRKNFTGVLAGVSEGVLRLDTGQKRVSVPLDGILKAHLVNDTEKSHVDF
jgi:ribosome maturation factor RimP